MIRLHILGLAHLPTDRFRDPIRACAYTCKVARLIEMMSTLPDYHIIFYGVEGSKTEADEEVIVLDEKTRQEVYGDLDDFANKFFKHNPQDKAYQTFIKNAIAEINKRKQPNDLLLDPMGNYYAEIVNKVGLMCCESGIGYTGFLKNTHKVFESAAWQHLCYGLINQQNGDYYDTVIPNYYNPAEYKYTENKEDYFFQNCRIAHRKGIIVSKQTVEAIGAKLLIAGQPGEDVDLNSPNVEYLGYVTEEEKRELLAHAKALFQPTTYIGPFEGVTVEAQMSGCPVITTNFGCFTETVLHGITGYRCNTQEQFTWAAKNIDKIKPADCRKWAVDNFSMERVKYMYDEYFHQLYDLFGKGWYAEHPERKNLDWLNRYYPATK